MPPEAKLGSPSCGEHFERKQIVTNCARRTLILGLAILMATVAGGCTATKTACCAVVTPALMIYVELTESDDDDDDDDYNDIPTVLALTTAQIL